MPAPTPEPPYLAVIFTSRRVAGDDGYEETAARMFELAAEQPGFLGIETAREDEGITVCYWRDEESITGWRENAEHQLAREQADRWYRSWSVRVARVERAYGTG